MIVKSLRNYGRERAHKSAFERRESCEWMIYELEAFYFSVADGKSRPSNRDCCIVDTVNN